jgi:large subunit ribosomal protein L3
MIEGLIGKKVGMTQFYDNGVIVPVTILQAGPCVVVQRKTKKNDGYDAVQIGFVEARAKKKVSKPVKGHFDKAKVPPTKVLREFKLKEGAQLNPGDRILVSLFKETEKVDVQGVSKGLGFMGVVKRHGFRGGPATHGSMFHRAPGSIGSSSYPSRVFKGMKMGGREGCKQVSVKKLRVVQIDEENNLLVVKGAVPGPNGSTVIIKKSRSVKKQKK